jgi:hypothetical protein
MCMRVHIISTPCKRLYFSGHIPYVAQRTSSWTVKVRAPEAILEFRQVGLCIIIVHTNRFSPCRSGSWADIPNGLRTTKNCGD